MGFSSPSGAPVTVLCTVGVDCCFASGTVAGFALLAAELSLMTVTLPSVFGAACLLLQLGASGLSTGLQARTGHVGARYSLYVCSVVSTHFVCTGGPYGLGMSLWGVHGDCVVMV